MPPWELYATANYPHGATVRYVFSSYDKALELAYVLYDEGKHIRLALV